MAGRFYLDASAFIAILLRDKRSAELVTETSSGELLSSVVLVLEVQRNLVRLVRERKLSTADYHACSEKLRAEIVGFALRDATLDLCDSTLLPAASLPRSLDLLHLRSALWFHQQEPLTRFISLDVAQNRAAIELGLPT